MAGPENALALACVEALARGESAGLSPLVVHGPAGSGKSRLLEGLVADWVSRRPGAVVAHLGGEAFAARCDEAAGAGREGWADLRARFRGVELFALDDLHALERSPAARAELIHTMDALDEAGAIVAVTARVGPGQWQGWPSRVVSRFVGGLAVRVDPPGPATRRRAVLDGARKRSVVLSAEAADALADAADGFRTIDGWLARLALASRLDGRRRPLDRDSALALLTDDGATPGAGPSLDAIAAAVAARFGVRPRDLRGSSRRAALAVPRHLAMLLARELTPASFAAIGRHFGGRDPATVRHACRAAAARIAADPSLAALAEALRRPWRRAEA
ncbi:MAG TPA: helix-turn-helix domain-containing protein [Isosphaeraceae bacterium]|nr:helix-turn-helix domain-containing protein [Isosphaeraceae bacterium]